MSIRSNNAIDKLRQPLSPRQELNCGNNKLRTAAKDEEQQGLMQLATEPSTNFLHRHLVLPAVSERNPPPSNFKLKGAPN